MGEKLVALGEELKAARTSAEKVRIAAEVHRFASEDLGGITFMSDDIHRVMGGVGQIPGTTACMSLFIPKAEQLRTVLPVLSTADAGCFADMLYEAVDVMAGEGLLPKAEEVLRQNYRNPWAAED